ncbi:unnamed protein product [Schistocephalus solidus]|uniref:Uncharacterized protein n=1 Tax=Schistocephalus solidus TaxID=70667 RepID=A0A183TM28_SCHSO|nr:unnamed protein product [Schistocephalus solidus]
MVNMRRIYRTLFSSPTGAQFHASVKKPDDGRVRRWLAQPELPLGVPPHDISNVGYDEFNHMLHISVVNGRRLARD